MAAKLTIPAPDYRNPIAVAHQLRGGAGAGPHRDAKAYRRKPKHPRREED